MNKKDKNTVKKEIANNVAERIEVRESSKNNELDVQVNEVLTYYKKRKAYTFGEVLCICIKKAKKPVWKISEELGVSERHISRWKNNLVKDISFRTIIAICIVLHVTFDTAEELLNLKKYSLNCDEAYVQLCKIFILNNISLTVCNEILKNKGLKPLTTPKDNI